MIYDSHQSVRGESKFQAICKERKSYQFSCAHSMWRVDFPVHTTVFSKAPQLDQNITVGCLKSIYPVLLSPVCYAE